MIIGGFRKVTLQDFPGYVAAMCFTMGCQLACPYCHNPGLVFGGKPMDDQTEDFLGYLKRRQDRLEGVVVSGGEPLIHKDIGTLLLKIKEMNLKVKLDTNGLMSQRLKEVLELNLVDYVALDYKNCSKWFGRTTGRKSKMEDDSTRRWQETLACLRRSQVSYEIRTTLVRELHPPEAIEEMANLLGKRTEREETWFLQTYKKSREIINDSLKGEENLSPYSPEEMEKIRQRILSRVPGVQIRG